MNILKIIKEEIEDFDWIKDNSIDGEELRNLILQQRATTIPFKHVDGDLYLYGTQIESLGNLESVGENLYLDGTQIESLGNLESVGRNLDLYGTPIKSLDNLKSVGGYLDLRGTPIKSLGNLKSVGGNLYLRGTPLAKKYSEEQIRTMVNVHGNIYLW